MDYYTLLTAIGAAKIAAATANNTTINLSHIALGDGAGEVVMPDPSQSELVNEVFRAALNDLSVDVKNDAWIVATGYIPADDGNFWVREVGIFDSDGDLIAVGNYPETFKPVLADGVAKDLYVKVIMEVSNSDAITLQIDPSVVMASREFVALELAKYALINGDSAKKFKVADAEADNEAINKSQAETLIANNVLVGAIIPYPVSVVPNGYLECNGAELSRDTYASLFAVIGVTYGAGNGSTTFRIPDTRGEFIRGFDNGRGVDTGRIIGTNQSDELKSHSHQLWGRIASAAGTANREISGVSGNSNVQSNSFGGLETRPRNIAMMYCIKY